MSLLGRIDLLITISSTISLVNYWFSLPSAWFQANINISGLNIYFIAYFRLTITSMLHILEYWDFRLAGLDDIAFISRRLWLVTTLELRRHRCLHARLVISADGLDLLLVEAFTPSATFTGIDNSHRWLLFYRHSTGVNLSSQYQVVNINGSSWVSTRLNISHRHHAWSLRRAVTE